MILCYDWHMEKENRKRRNTIFQYIQEQNKVSVTELAGMLGVTKETIRLDLEYLEHSGKITRIRGGAILCEDPQEVPVQFRKETQEEEKKKIAKAAISYVEDHSTIYLDASTTVLSLLPYLNAKKNLTIFTNSTLVASQLEKQTVYLLGGLYYAKGSRTTGTRAAEEIQNEYFDLCFMSCDGIAGKNGLATGFAEEVSLMRTAVEHSSKCILLADSTKFTKRAPHQFSKITDFDVVITTANAKQSVEDLDIKKIVFA